MCGIFATTGGQLPKKDVLAHRGPDSFTSKQINKIDFMFWRLAINGGDEGNQPFEHNGKWLIANAEIYNHIELDGQDGRSDCEVILPLIEKYGLFRTCEIMSGDFAFVFTDGYRIWAARDRVGVRPLFYCRHDKGIAFASEVKALVHFGKRVEIFPPGHLYADDTFVSWAPNYWDCPRADFDEDFVKGHIRYLMTNAVSNRVKNSDQPVGFFLSGGLDSSIVASLGKQILGTKIRTFSIGLTDSPDLAAARHMAEYLDSDHTEVVFSIEEGLKAVSDVVQAIETFDTTTVRASVPMYLLSKYIRENTDIRVVLSGEGSDELFGGYLYFHGAPSTEDFLRETGRLVRDVHMFDVLRADRTTAAHGLELRVPFFDRDVIDYVMDGFDPSLKQPKHGFEKALLRHAFEDILPQTICWRQKDGMSDAVGHRWVESLRVSNEKRYESVFNSFYEHQKHLVPYKWLPKWTDVTDPSARLLGYFLK